MKDLEKIKSEDLGCQVADANPGNFGIEQEVAQLVGATVPAPTEPSDDDARELGAQLLVFLRRALLPIRSALRTALADIYDYLDSRCTDYTPAAYAPFTPTHHAYDPMGSTPRTLPNLLTAITAFAPRKISNGSAPNDGIKDGESLARILCDATALPTKIIDDKHGWTLTKVLNMSLTDVTLGCKNIDTPSAFSTPAVVTASGEVHFDDLEICRSRQLISGGSGETLIFPKLTSFRAKAAYVTMIGSSNYENIIFPVLTDYMDGNHYYGNSTGIVLNSPGVKYIECTVLPKTNGSGNVNLFYNNQALEEIYLPGFTNHNISIMRNCPALKKLTLGKITAWSVPSRGDWDAEYDEFKKEVNLIDIVFGEGSAANINLANWNPTNVLADADKTATFLQNFRDHIALRLTSNGSGKTLTLSQAVFSAVIEGSSPICDDIKGIIEDKGWKVQDTNNNIFPTT